MKRKAKADKKSLVQLVLLVALIGIGVAAYFYQQGGGIDLGIITSFFDEKSADVSPPVSKPRVVRKRVKAAPRTPHRRAARKAEPAADAIPAHPAQGQLHGKPFVVAYGTIEDGALTLRQSKDEADGQEIAVLLFTKKWHVPVGEVFKVDAKSAADNQPHVHIAWSENGQKMHDAVVNGYRMRLEFGQEKDRNLPGKIYLALPNKAKTNIAGTFEARIKGFRIVKGKPDLTVDSPDTLRFLALRDVLKDDPGKRINNVYIRDTRYVNQGAPGVPITGYLEIEYRVGEAAPVIERYQFIKESNEWRILRTLKVSEIDEAHPYKAPGTNEPPPRLFTYLAARRIEAELKKKYPNKGVRDAEFAARYSDRHKLGVCEVSYRLGRDAKPLRTAYLFRLKRKNWVLDRKLRSNERVNFDTGRLERR